jgi:hypothetical protein
MAQLDPAFKPLEKLIGTWKSRGRTLDATEDNIFAETTFEPFLEGKYIKITNRMNFDSENAKHVHESLEILSYDPKTGKYPTAAYSTLSEGPGRMIDYEWAVEADGTIIHSGAGAIYRGKFSEAGNVLKGGWRPDESGDGRDEASYDLTMTRVS